jgi:proteasome lid subunit RPN8/RPN11
VDEFSMQRALAHAQSEFPRESCGLLVVQKGRQRYVSCRNMAQGTDQFVIHPEDYANAQSLGEIIAVVHSHPKTSAEPSQADRVSCEATGFPWFIVSVPTGVWCEIKPSGYVAPLVGRQWCHGVLDCYSLVRDWFSQVRGVELADFVRHDQWWKHGQNLYLENFAAAGFVAIDAPQAKEGDCFLMQVGADVPNHAAVYLGDGHILHHVQGRLSSRDVYGGYWQKITTHCLRYVKPKEQDSQDQTAG